MIATAVLGILLAIAFPDIRGVTLRSQLSSGAEAFAADLNRARTEAVKRNSELTISFDAPDSYTIEHLGPGTLEPLRFESVPEDVTFAPFGPPVTGSAAFVLQAGEFEKTVIMDASGFSHVR